MLVDVVVVGSGAAGLTAAVVAAKAGLKVVVLESTSQFGGTSALSGGGVWIPENHHMAQLNQTDSREEAVTYLKSVLGDLYDEAKLTTYVDKAAEMLTFMEQESSVQLMATMIPDYEPSQPGWKEGRCLLAVDFDGRKLGKHLDKLRKPIPEMGLFQRMQLSAMDAFRMLRWNRSPGDFFYSAGKIIRFALQSLFYGRSTTLCNGNALAGRLLKSALDAGVVLWHDAPAKKLLLENGAVKGVVCEKDGLEVTLNSSKGVVLASGGFGANAAMRKKYIPLAEHGWSFQPEGCQGQGIAMGIDAGGVLNDSNEANAIWVPGTAFKRSDGSLAKFPSLFFDRHSPGFIYVDAATGKRFCNEGFHYQSFGSVAIEKGIEKIWMIADAGTLAKYGMGMVKPAPFPKRRWLNSGYLIEDKTIAGLAGKLGLDPEVLGNTVKVFNDGAVNGQDPEFKRGEDKYSVFMGDPDHQPNPSVAPIVKAPFYAIEVRPSDLCTLQGLNTNAAAQVLSGDNEPIPGLYAAGIDSNTVMKGLYPGGGTSLGPAMTFGYIAAKHMAGN